jgi:RNA polymerase primary sigma factor
MKKAFEINPESTPIKKSETFKKFEKDLGFQGRIVLDQYSEYYYIRKIQQFSDPYSAHELLKAHILFIMVVARQMSASHLSFDDMINEGCLGFIKAAHRFDHTKGHKFLSYAVWWIRSSISKFIFDYNEFVHIPLNQIKDLRTVNKATDYFYKENGCDCSYNYEYVADIADLPYFSGIDSLLIAPTRSKIISLDDRYESFVSPDTLEETVLKVEDSFIFEDDFVDDELREYSLRVELSRSLNTLTEREADILVLFFGLGIPLKHQGVELDPCIEHTTDEIGEAFELVGGRINQIKLKAIKRLRHTSRSKLLRSYLG